MAGFGFLKAAVDSRRFTVGVEAERGPWPGLVTAAPGVALILASAGVESEAPIDDDVKVSRPSDDGEKTPFLDCGVM